MTRPGFVVRSDDDLQLPLLTAVSDAEKAGTGELRVRIAPGTYKRGLALRAAGGDDKLSFLVEPDATGTVTLGGGIAIAGKRVTLRGVIVDGARTPATVVALRAAESLEVTGCAIVGASVGSGGGERDPVLDLVALAPGAKAQLRDLWIVDSTAGEAPLVRIPVNGKGRWASVALENVAFVGNRSGSGIAATMTDALTIRGAFVAEPALGAAWLQIGTFGEVAIESSVIAVRKGLVEHDETADGKYPTVKVTSSELLGPRKSEHVAANDTRWGKPPPASIDSGSAAARARAGTPPDRFTLRAIVPQ